jgi:hypothetical protein
VVSAFLLATGPGASAREGNGSTGASGPAGRSVHLRHDAAAFATSSWQEVLTPVQRKHLRELRTGEKEPVKPRAADKAKGKEAKEG